MKTGGTFTQNLKRELCGAESDGPEGSRCGSCGLCELYGALLFGHTFSRENIRFHTGSRGVAARIAELYRQNVGREPLRVRASGYVIAPGEAGLPYLLSALPHSFDAVTLRLDARALGPKCCRAAFLRGVFLACGYMSDPARGYLMEFSTPHYSLCGDLRIFLEECELSPARSVRNSLHTLSFKGSEAIEDLLATMGAMQTFYAFTDVRILRELRNNANRVANCEASNIDRAVAAASGQLEDARLIARLGHLDRLPAPLREAAEMRLARPALSLEELGAAMSPPLGKSGMRHRMKKLSEYAADLRKN